MYVIVALVSGLLTWLACCIIIAVEDKCKHQDKCVHPLFAVYSIGRSAGPMPGDNFSSFKCDLCGVYIRRYDNGKVEVIGK